MLTDPGSVGDQASVAVHGQEMRQVNSFQGLRVDMDDTGAQCWYKNQSGSLFFAQTQSVW